MSAPQTNIEKQKRRHRGPLIGMALVLLFVGTLLLYWLSVGAMIEDSPQGAAVQIQGQEPRTEGE